MSTYSFAHKKFLLIGFGKSGYSLANVLVKLHARVVITDSQSLENNTLAQELKEKGVTILDGGNPLSLADQSFDYVVKNPGIRYDNPLIQRFTEKGVSIITEIEIGYLLQQHTVIGITGSNGKTTTTSLIWELLIQNNQSAKKAGNIGYVFSEVVFNAQPDDIIVTELSSFQLQGTMEFRPNISVLLNIQEAHLDYHGTVSSYIQAKKKLITQQTEHDYCIFNYDDEIVRKMVTDTKAKTLGFSTKEPKAYGYFDGTIFYINQEPVAHIHSVLLRGKHNIENMLAAIISAKILGVPNHSIQETLNSFNGVEHRLQHIDTVQNRSFYNDSKSTNLFATQTALNAFNEPVVLLMGGLDRGVDFHVFSPYFQKVKAVVSFGQVRDAIREAAQKSGCPLTFSCRSVEKAVEKAYSLSREGDVILFSPGCASWDSYSSFEERGADFINQIKQLKHTLQKPNTLTT